jgi:hypothetical protein
MLQHTPVLLQEVLAALDIRAGGRYLDATFGRGGHSAAILERLGPQGALIAFDRDREAIAAGRERFANDGRVTLVGSAFSRLSTVVAQMGLVGGIDGVLLDLGVSSPQLDDASRGFSFTQDGPLDMRMDDTAGASAATDSLSKRRRVASIRSNVSSISNLSSGENFRVSAFDTARRSSGRLRLSAASASSRAPPPSGITKAVATRRSGDVRTSATVIDRRFSSGSCTSPFASTSLNVRRISSPTRS